MASKVGSSDRSKPLVFQAMTFIHHFSSGFHALEDCFSGQWDLVKWDWRVGPTQRKVRFVGWKQGEAGRWKEVGRANGIRRGGPPALLERREREQSLAFICGFSSERHI